MDGIDIKGIDKAELLVALHGGTRALGMGMLHDRGAISIEDARAAMSAGGGPSGTTGNDGNSEVAQSFDYLAGRPLKVTFKGDQLLGTWLYDRDAPGGEGSCQRIVDGLRARATKAA